MTLFTTTILTAGSLLFLGAGLLWKPKALQLPAMNLLRSSVASTIVFGAAAVAFLWQIAHLSEADFGNHRQLLFGAFLLIALLSFVYASDFLVVRGLAILAMLASSAILDSAYLQTNYPQRLFLVGFVYLLIILALYLGAVPFRMRDFLEWLFGRTTRCRTIGALLVGYGMILTLNALSY